MAAPRKDSFPKTPTGIDGLDEITYGGFPKGRAILICGSAGCGKTLFAMQFLVKGITEFDEPGVFMSFEETAEDLAQNVRSLGFDLEKLKANNKLHIDHVRLHVLVEPVLVATLRHHDSTVPLDDVRGDLARALRNEPGDVVVPGQDG